LPLQLPNRDGYLVDMSGRTPEAGRLMAEADGYGLNEKKCLGEDGAKPERIRYKPLRKLKALPAWKAMCSGWI